MEKMNGVVLKLSVNKTFENNFRYLMSKVYDKEWGGLVIYRIENYFFDKVIKIRLLDFVLMDIGSAAETNNDYAEDPEFVTKLLQYPETNYGLIHSHTHTVYYSPTDEKEIEKNIDFYPEGYLSVVVNSRGDILARLTQEFETKATTKIMFNGAQRTITEVFTDLYYVETEININKETDYIFNKLNVLSERAEARKEAAKLTNKYKNNHMHSHTPQNNKFISKEEEDEILEEMYGYGASESLMP